MIVNELFHNNAAFNNHYMTPEQEFEIYYENRNKEYGKLIISNETTNNINSCTSGMANNFL